MTKSRTRPKATKANREASQTRPRRAPHRRRIRRSPSRRRANRSGLAERIHLFEIDPFQILTEVFAEIRPAKREVHDRLQESQLVAGVVAGALDTASVNRPRLQQLPKTVGQLDLPGAIRLGGFERREDVRREDV